LLQGSTSHFQPYIESRGSAGVSTSNFQHQTSNLLPLLVAIYNRSFEEANIGTLQHIVEMLETHRIGMVFYKDFYERLQPHVTFNTPPRLFTGNRDLPANTDMLFSLGGDGTMLDTISFVGNSNIPLIGINLGRLGFLAAIPVEEVDDAILSLVRGSYTLEKRSLLHLDSSTTLPTR